MGFTLPSPNSPRERVKALMERKDNIQLELDTQFAILKTNSCTMNTPLVDRDGFPRADIDVYNVRIARTRVIELRNDMTAIMDEIGKALQEVYALQPEEEQSQQTSGSTSADPTVPTEELKPFARVDGVDPSGPSAEAGLRREDLILQFGDLTRTSFSNNSLQPLARLVAASENRSLQVKVHRGGQETVTLSFTPRTGWGGRGLLGCHIVPISQ